jgi:rubrerythrin
MERERRDGDKPTDFGFNRTGIATSPIDTPRMVQAATEAETRHPGGNDAIAVVRGTYIEEAEPLGSVPPPTTIKGAGEGLAQMLQGHKPTVLIDKLGERIAFERTGTRLYGALLAKCTDDATDGGPTRADAQEIQQEEMRHLDLVLRHARALGADPTVQTPCADVAGVQAMGVLQVVSDPRTTLSQSLNAVLTAELADEAGWELLIALATAAGHKEMAAEFTTALEAEAEHVRKVKGWLLAMTSADAKLLG